MYTISISKYIDEVIATSEKTLNSLDSNEKVDIYSNLMFLEAQIGTIIELYSHEQLPGDCNRVLNELLFRGFNRYESGILSNGQKRVLFFIPIYGWIKYIKSQKRFEECKSDLKILTGKLRLLSKELKSNDL